MQLFHASPFKFEHFTLDHIGKGEGGIALGYGLYLSEDLKVARRFEDYFLSRCGQAHLYTVTLQAKRHEILDLDSDCKAQPPSERIDYQSIRTAKGDTKAFEKLLSMGFKGVRDFVQDDRGYVFLCVQPTFLRIDRCETRNLQPKRVGETQ
ncbi:hypothetical protein os4_35620 (plasmid) [Comamonadaceae bacterium OS-4]|nr:hypothetical protein os4_35620 [Comamonadaceae bacterium OS-4]